MGWKGKSLINTKKPNLLEEVRLFKWYHQESNRGHKDFQSFALPTELWHHTFADDFSFAGAKVQQLFGSAKFLSEKLFKKDKKVLFYLVLWRIWRTFASSLCS